MLTDKPSKYFQYITLEDGLKIGKLSEHLGSREPIRIEATFHGDVLAQEAVLDFTVRAIVRSLQNRHFNHYTVNGVIHDKNGTLLSQKSGGIEGYLDWKTEFAEEGSLRSFALKSLWDTTRLNEELMSGKIVREVQYPYTFREE
jgi:hypothetical protein